MSEFAPVRSMADLAVLDGDEIVAGYVAALDGAPEPGSDRSRAYWHGWRNGRVDMGGGRPDEAQQQLACAFVRHGKLQ